MTDYLCKDFEKNRDLNKLFQDTNPRVAYVFKSLDEFISRMILRREKILTSISFLFSSRNLQLVKRNIEEQFGDKFNYICVKHVLKKTILIHYFQIQEEENT